LKKYGSIQWQSSQENIDVEPLNREQPSWHGSFPKVVIQNKISIN
jgi:hypothetical protein